MSCDRRSKKRVNRGTRQRFLFEQCSSDTLDRR
jgi:hypothetical protein